MVDTIKQWARNKGVEIIENEAKIARYHSKRPPVIVFEKAYHRRTLLTMKMTSKVKPYKFGFGTFTPEVYWMRFCNSVGSKKIKGFLLTMSIRRRWPARQPNRSWAEGRSIAVVPGYFQKLARICRESGIARTARIFTIEHRGWSLV